MELREAAEAQNVALQATKAASSAADAELAAAKEAYLSAVGAVKAAQRLLADPPPRVNARMTAHSAHLVEHMLLMPSVFVSLMSGACVERQV